MTITSVVFPLTMGERMTVALRRSKITSASMAMQLGVSRQTISGWMNGHVEPRLGMMRLWALYTNSDLRWLCEGHPGMLQAYELALATEQFPDLRVVENEDVVPPAGIEPATDRLEGGCSFR